MSKKELYEVLFVLGYTATIYICGMLSGRVYELRRQERLRKGRGCKKLDIVL